MTKLTKPKLVEIFVETIQRCGAIVEYRTPRGTHPAVLNVRTQEFNTTYRVYIWNLTRGGANRPIDEYRIQTSGIDGFECKQDQKTLILGYWAPLELFIAFDYSKHTERLGRSVSLQLREKSLHEGALHGMSTYPKDNGEIVVVFDKLRVLIYLKHQESIHMTSKQLSLLQHLEGATNPVGT